MIGLFMNAYRSSLPVTRMHLRFYTDSSLILSWENPVLLNGTPCVDSYEVELFNTNTNTTLLLPSISTTCTCLVYEMTNRLYD